MSDEHEGEQPPVSPYLIIQATEFDLGSRPISENEAKNSISIEILDASGTHVDTAAAGVKPNTAYTVRCKVFNKGTAGLSLAYMTLSIGSPTQFDQAAAHGGIVPVYDTYGIMGSALDVDPGELVTVDFKTQINFGDAGSVASVLVQVDDPRDPIETPFDAKRDRHVGRLDILTIS